MVVFMIVCFVDIEWFKLSFWWLILFLDVFLGVYYVYGGVYFYGYVCNLLIGLEFKYVL